MRTELNSYIEVIKDAYPGKKSEVIIEYLNKIEYDGDNDMVYQCLPPCVCNIVSKLYDKDYWFIKDNYNILVQMVNVESITNKLIICCDEVLPIMEKYLQHIDSQANTLSLFCDNYVNGLINRLKKDKQFRISKLLTLEKLSLLNDEKEWL